MHIKEKDDIPGCYNKNKQMAVSTFAMVGNMREVPGPGDDTLEGNHKGFI